VTRWLRFVLALLLLLCAIGGSVVFAQAVASAGAAPTDGLDPGLLSLLGSVTGIITLSIGATAFTQRAVGTHKWFGWCPLWIYTELWTIVFTLIANKLLHTLPGTTTTLVLNALYNGASASGVYSWVSNGLTTPMSATAGAIRAAKIVVLVTCVGLAGGLASSCSKTTQIPPALPTVTATTDLDVRASIYRAYQDIGGALDLLKQVNLYELALNKTGAVPADVHHTFGAGIIKAAQGLDRTNTKILTKVLTTYAAVKAEVDPILADLNVLLGLSKSGGFNWTGLISGIVNLLMDITSPGFGGGDPMLGTTCAFAR
jgi:hypothetical protein